MKMMQTNMKKMMAMKPKPNMTIKENKHWIAEHQKLMNQMMEQMMSEHDMMMGKGCMSKDMGDTQQ